MSKRTLVNDLEDNLSKRVKGYEQDNYFATIPNISYDAFQYLAQYLFQNPNPVDYIRLGKLENLFINNPEFDGDTIDKYFNPLWERLYKRDYTSYDELKYNSQVTEWGEKEMKPHFPSLSPNFEEIDKISKKPNNKNTYWKRAYEQKIQPIVRSYMVSRKILYEHLVNIDKTRQEILRQVQLTVYLPENLKLSDGRNNEGGFFAVRCKTTTRNLIAIAVYDNKYDYIAIIHKNSIIKLLGKFDANTYISNVIFNNNENNPLLSITTSNSFLGIYNLKTGQKLFGSKMYPTATVGDYLCLEVTFNQNGDRFITRYTFDSMFYDDDVDDAEYEKLEGFILWGTQPVRQLKKIINPDRTWATYDIIFLSDVYIATYSLLEIRIFNLNTGKLERVLIPPIVNPVNMNTRGIDPRNYKILSIERLPNGNILAKYNNNRVIEWDPSPKMLVSCSICSISTAIHTCTECNVKLCDNCSTE